jgi:hypothetical protein
MSSTVMADCANATELESPIASAKLVFSIVISFAL